MNGALAGMDLAEHERQARTLCGAANAGDEQARWRFKWEHPRFASIADVRAATLTVEDARLVVAHEQGFETWADLVRFIDEVSVEGPVLRFERAVEAVVDGDVAALRAALTAEPALARARSTRRHHATLLHYVAANGVEGGRQRTPANAIDVAKVLLAAGAEVDALADLYGQRCTTMSMLVSSAPPAKAGLQAALAETLIDYGAALDGPGTSWPSALMTALAFGHQDTAQALVRRGASVHDVAAAAGLGRLDEASRLLPAADARARHVALALAAQHGHPDVVRLLLDAGEDPSRYNPDGFHPHSTPLHQAVYANHQAVVRLLVDRGARLDVRDTVYGGTPLDWAIHGGRTELVHYLRERGAPTT